MKLFLGIVAFGAMVAMAAPAEAACTCTCVGGQVQAICQSAIDMKPICSPQICQTPPPSVRPPAAPTIAPVGTRSCSQQQVLNPVTHQYQWQTLCR